MDLYKEKIIIGIDHGYGNIKTANHIFRTGVLKHDSEPLFTKNLLVYYGIYYTVGVSSVCVPYPSLTLIGERISVLQYRLFCLYAY